MTQATAVPCDLLLGHGFTGPRSLVPAIPGHLPAAPPSAWTIGYEELIRPLYFAAGAAFWGFVYCYTASSPVAHGMEALPVPRHEGPAEAVSALQTIERAFGDSASELARILRVSRPMVYHYRQGMQPSVENFRRLRLIASLADYVSTETGVTLGPVLKSPQPEGQSLLDLLSEETPDIPLIRRILLRTSQDLQKRQRLATTIAYATPHDRQDIMRARHSVGKPIYVSDPELSGKIIQIRPDQSRVRGRMLNRVFVPDEE
jgi:transcriptional regulator with XRE-family HTH domain